MKKRKYQSHEHKFGNVWLHVWRGDDLDPCGSIEVDGETSLGYRILRRSRFSKSFPSRSPNLLLGDAGVFFDKRKDAENFALVLAMYFSGDFQNKALIEPEIFNGIRVRATRFGERRRALFWEGIDQVDPRGGWGSIDPDAILTQLPDIDQPVPINEDFEMESRGYEISEAAHAVCKFFLDWFLTDKINAPLMDILSSTLRGNEFEYLEVEESEFGYVALLAVAMLREQLPINWAFPGGDDRIRNELSELWKGLPAYVLDYISNIQANEVRIRERAELHERMKGEVLALLPAGPLRENQDIMTRVNACISHFLDLQSDKSAAPSHSEGEYRVLMNRFATRASADKAGASAWLASEVLRLGRR